MDFAGREGWQWVGGASNRIQAVTHARDECGARAISDYSCRGESFVVSRDIDLKT